MHDLPELRRFEVWLSAIRERNHIDDARACLSYARSRRVGYYVMRESEIDTDVFEDELIQELLRFVEEGTASDDEPRQNIDTAENSARD